MNIRSVRVLRTVSVSALCILMVAVSAYSQQGIRSARNDESRIQEWIRNACAKDPHVQRLYTRADAYGRMLRLRAAYELGIPLSALSAREDGAEFSPLSQSNDSGVAVDVSKSTQTQQNETTIAINRKDPNIIVAGANDERMYSNGVPVYATSNSGATWSRLFFKTQTPSSGTWVELGDPVLAAGADGTFYYAYIYGDPSTGPQLVDNFVVATSTNGRIWKNGTPVLPEDMISGFEDKETLCVDNSPLSPHFGRVYIAWLHLEWDGTGETRIAYSDDHCETWSQPTVLEQTYEEFGQVKTGMHGEVFVTYSLATFDSTGNPATYHVMYVSTDGGDSFESRVVHTFTDFPTNVDGYNCVKGNNGPRCYPYMSFDVDSRNNTLHLVYGSEWNDEGAAEFYVKSTNLGKTWSTPVAIGYGGSTPGSQTILDRFCPTVTVNQSTGDAFMTCYSSERDPNNQLVAPFRYHLNAAASELPKPLEETDFDPMIVGTLSGKTAFIGDYLGADLVDSVYAAAWTEGVEYDGEVFVYIGLPNSATGPSAVAPMLIGSNRLRVASVYPNPATAGRITFGVFSPVTSDATIELFDIGGNKLTTLWSGRLEAAEASRLECRLPAEIAAGTYLVHLRTPEAEDIAKIVVQQ